MRMRTALLLTATLSLPILAGAAGAPAWTSAAPAPADLLRRAIAAICPGAPEPAILADRLRARAPIVSDSITVGGRAVGRRHVVALTGGGELRLERFAPGGVLRRVSADYRVAAAGDGNSDGGGEKAARPTMLAIAGGDCRILHGRRLTYTPSGAREALLKLGPDLETLLERQPLNPPVPAGADPGGVRVAVVDSGVAYTLPQVAARLARDEAGAIAGYDYWEIDRRPFDGDTAASPYFPRHHGTEVAALLLREAPEAALVPYRYPRPDMSRMADVVADAAAAGVRIVVMPLGSRDAGRWSAFAEAARRHPDMLFIVAAGNTGRNLDVHPIWPPALDLDNMLVVTSCETDGRLAPGSSWGPDTVDLMVPAERLRVIDWRGHAKLASGTSYAAPRLAALAARLLAADPGLRTAALSRAIVERARPAPGARQATRHGWIKHPEEGP